MKPLMGKAKPLAIISIVLIIIISYGLFFYVENTNEQDIRNSIIEQELRNQLKDIQALSRHIGTDLTLVVDNLHGLASSKYIQQGDLSSNKTKKLAEETFTRLNGRDSIIDRLVIINKTGFETVGLTTKGQLTFVGTNVSSRPWVKETLESQTPTFSNGFVGLDGKYRIAIGYPITNLENGQYIGLLGALVPFESFLSQHGNVYNVNSKFLVAYDKNATMLATATGKALIGKNFFGSYAQQYIKHNEVLNNLVRNILAGRPAYAIYNYGNGERLSSGYPIYAAGKAAYFVHIVAPTAEIYSYINDVLFAERIKMFSLITGTTAAIAILIVFIIKWSSLNEEVKRRGKDLEEANKDLETANKQLSSANEQLKVHDKMQRDFINIAAHELRTPIQPLLLCSQYLKHKMPNEEYVDIVARSAKKLQTLANAILDAARIEGGTFKLYKERVNIKDIISDSLQITNGSSYNTDNELRIKYEPHDIFVEADKDRMIQVVSNLLNNAAKSITAADEEQIENENENENEKENEKEKVPPIISVITQIKGDNELVVNVKDTGQGIDPESLPRLFTRFATKPERGGTGLGLFISKSIVEAHGGQIWAANNTNGKGATFSFSLPL
jgi:signal transduction histidine kinase